MCHYLCQAFIAFDLWFNLCNKLSILYSILYYNSEVWHYPTLKATLQARLLSASAKAIKACTRSSDLWMLNYEELHEMAGRATPVRLMYYKLALQLHKTTNLQIPTTDWISLNLNNVATSRQTTFITNKTNNYRVGMNSLSNRLWYLNGKIHLDWLGQSFNTFKIKCKCLLLAF